jgi:uncharacterized protein YhfF
MLDPSMTAPSPLTKIEVFVQDAARAIGQSIDAFDSFAFGDSPEMADALLALVVSGQKRATASLAQSYSDEGAPLPEVGALSVVLDGAGEPAALIRTSQVDVVPFDDVDATFARDEGEGDGSLDYWRAAHRAYFERSGTAFDQRALVVCERFALLYGVPRPS